MYALIECIVLLTGYGTSFYDAVDICSWSMSHPKTP